MSYYHYQQLYKAGEGRSIASTLCHDEPRRQVIQPSVPRTSRRMFPVPAGGATDKGIYVWYLDEQQRHQKTGYANMRGRRL